jgi:predicted component of type VI protein secretion system
MAYLRVTFGNQEIERCDLTGPLALGRSPDCHIAVRDVLLSRKHCRIEPASGGQWRAVELGSKNGTTLNGEVLAAAADLADGDELKLGRVTVRFGAGRLADAGLMPLKAAPLRPADPTEAMSATCAGFVFLEPGESPSMGTLPRPLPSPRPPAAYERENIYRLLSTIASSSWDSIYAEARRPLPAPAAGAVRMDLAETAPRHRPRSPIDLSLQVCPRETAAPPPRSPRRPRIRRLMNIAATWIVIVLAILAKGRTDARVPLSPPPAAAAASPAPTPPPTPDVPGAVWLAANALLPVLL